jgi:NADH-quinone oxidoreductase subunit J
MVEIVFDMLSLCALVSAVFAVYSKETINSALGFMITLLSLAGIFALLSASFLFLIQIIVYVGAILTLILLVIMFLNLKEENLPKEPNKKRYFIVSLLFILPIDFVFIKAVSALDRGDFGVVKEGFGSLKEVGTVLYNDWILPFELVSILLIVSLVGAIVFAKRRI